MKKTYLLQISSPTEIFSDVEIGLVKTLKIETPNFKISDANIQKGDSLLVCVENRIYYYFDVVLCGNDRLQVRKVYEITAKTNLKNPGEPFCLLTEQQYEDIFSDIISCYFPTLVRREEKESHQIKALIVENNRGEFVFKVLRYLYALDGLKNVRGYFKENKDDQFISIKKGDISLTSIFRTSKERLTESELTSAKKDRWFEESVFSIPPNFFYLSREWTYGKDRRLDIESFTCLINETYPQFVITEESGSFTFQLRNGLKGENIIYFGPPGTGKSTLVHSKTESSVVLRTQFHPEYTHSDLVGVYRSVVGYEKGHANQFVGHDSLVIDRPFNYFAFVPGPLAIALARSFRSSEHVFLVIEEINRGDCSAIFGDIFQLLDRNDAGRSEFGISIKPELLNYFKAEGVSYDIAADGKLYLPPNLSLLATMNTSDQSLFPMDSAFKRRWQWVACPIKFDELLSYSSEVRPFLNDGKEKYDWIKLLELVNKDIVRERMEDKQIGPWFIKPAKNGLVSWDAFLNKCLFYLWHDVFKDEQFSDHSPFRTDGPAVFGEVQENIRANGLRAGFKQHLLFPIDPGFERVANGSAETPTPPQAVI